MQSRGSNRALVGTFLALAVCSLAMKAGAGTPVYAASDEIAAPIEQRLVSALVAKGFVTSVRHLKLQSSIVYGTRGDCTLSARNAAAGPSVATAFAEDARRIGPVRYLYEGHAYSSPPALRIHLENVRDSVLHLVGLRAQVHIPIAIARSERCSDSDLGLQDVQIAA